MKINFKKTLEGERALKQYFTYKEPEFYSWRKKYVVKAAYNTSILETRLFEELQRSLKSNNFEFEKSSESSLWIIKPEKASLTLDSVSGHKIWGGVYEFNKSNSVQKGTKTRIRKLWLNKDFPIFYQIPRITAKGTILFSRLQGADSVPFIKVLRDLGYNSDIIPISEDLEELIQTIKKNK